MKRAFTLIELLVVIAIIGILSAVVLASLGVARERAREASIRSTLKNMSAEVELLYENSGNYAFVQNCHASSTHMLAKFVTALTEQGTTVRCSSLTVGDDATTRWGVTASILGATDLTAWSASSEGVVTWDSGDSNSGTATNWNNAMAACSSEGKRLATPEQLRSLHAITNTNPPPGFANSHYWSGVEVPSSPSTRAYINVMGSNGSAISSLKTDPARVRCVK